MSYNKLLKTGIVLEMREYGESGKLLKILTDEGVKSLVATGVRELYSKMRGEIDVLTEVEFEYVEGKEVMRLVGIFPKEKLFLVGGQDLILKRKIISNIVNFLLRIVVGETENMELYLDFKESVIFLNAFSVQEDMASVEDRKKVFEIIEIIFLVKILSRLGYWEVGNLDDFSVDNFKKLDEDIFRKKILEDINKSIVSTHL